LTLTRTQLLGLLLAGNTDGVSIEGDAALLGKVVALTETPDPDFAIVLP
jgi:ubiquinone biosynthesis protein UbiJ